MRLSLVLAFLVTLLVAAPVQAGCPRAGQVYIRAKTPVRRGPGLNYPVSRFLERGRCVGLEQVSVDGHWTMVRLGSRFGWVLTKRLDRKGQRTAAEAKAASSPVGSGTERGFAQVRRRAVLRERPQPGAPPRRVLPKGVRVLPLRITEDALWTEVRDDRGDMGWVEVSDLEGGKLESLPRFRTETEVSVDELTQPLGVHKTELRARRRLGAEEGGVHLTASAFGAVFLPIQTLDSNGERGIRRYDLSAVAPGVALELQLTHLGPVTARMGFAFGSISGVSTDEEPDQAAGGTIGAFVLRAGWPLKMDTLVVTPEIGYAFEATALDVALPGATEAVFVSSESHQALAGARAQLPLGDAFLLDADLVLSLGSSSAGPGTLGSGGTAIGGRASVGVQYLFDEAFGLALQYSLSGWTANYSGTGSLDPTITGATLSEFRQGILIGASYSL